MPYGQQYTVGVVQRFMSLVLHCGASLRCAASVLELFGSATGPDKIAVNASTGRLWLLRVGLAAPLRPKTVAAGNHWPLVSSHRPLGTTSPLLPAHQNRLRLFAGFRLHSS